MAILLGFDQIWWARNVLCRRHNLHIEWNWRRWAFFMARFGWFGVVLGSGTEVVLGLVMLGVVLCDGWFLVIFTWWCYAPEGPRLLSVRTRFFFFFFLWLLIWRGPFGFLF